MYVNYCRALVSGGQSARSYCTCISGGRAAQVNILRGRHASLTKKHKRDARGWQQNEWSLLSRFRVVLPATDRVTSRVALENKSSHRKNE